MHADVSWNWRRWEVQPFRIKKKKSESEDAKGVKKALTEG